MDYRDILKDQLKRRQSLNPRFSLRSFATKLGISPSKISEVISGKKKLSIERLEELAKKLNLKGKEKEIFLTSAELESSKTQNKEDLKKKMKKLAQEIKAEQTTQRNAWYFGAVKSLEENGIDSALYREQMNLTDLQLENAKRFLKRINRFHPEREDLTFEPASLGKKINESLEESNQHLMAEFVLLDQEQISELCLKVRSLIKKFKTDRKSNNALDLHMVYFGVTGILREGK